MCESADMRAYAARLQHERLASAAKFLEFYAAKFCARMGKICNAFLRGKICSALLAGRFSAARRSKIRSVKYYAEFYVAAHGDKIYGVMTDKKGFGTALANVRNSGLKNACLNLRPRNTYADLKFKGSANSEPTGGVNFKFKSGASPGLTCGDNAKPLKPICAPSALSSSAASKILVFVLASKILVFAIASEILNSNAAARGAAFGEAARNLGSGGAEGILSSAETVKFLALNKAAEFRWRAATEISDPDDALKISASAKTTRILAFSAARILAAPRTREILKPNVASKILSPSAAPRTDFGPKGAGGC